MAAIICWLPKSYLTAIGLDFLVQDGKKTLFSNVGFWWGRTFELPRRNVLNVPKPEVS